MFRFCCLGKRTRLIGEDNVMIMMMICNYQYVIWVKRPDFLMQIMPLMMMILQNSDTNDGNDVFLSLCPPSLLLMKILKITTKKKSYESCARSTHMVLKLMLNRYTFDLFFF